MNIDKVPELVANLRIPSNAVPKAINPDARHESHAQDDICHHAFKRAGKFTMITTKARIKMAHFADGETAKMDVFNPATLNHFQSTC